MSTWVSVERACPRCSKPQTLTLARSLHVSRSPDARQLLLDGKLHTSTCTSCATTFGVDCAFEYLDFARRELFMVFPIAEEARWAELEQLPAQLFEPNLTNPEAPPRLRELGEGFRVRAVFGLAQLREKVLLFETGVDDAVAEAWKLAWMREAPQERLHLECRPRLHSRKGEHLRFVGKPRGAQPQILAVEIANLGAHSVEEPLVRSLATGAYVDAARLIHLPN